MHHQDLLHRGSSTGHDQLDVGPLCKLTGVQIAHSQSGQANVASFRELLPEDELKVLGLQPTGQVVAATSLRENRELVKVVTNVPATHDKAL